ncbi:aminopeptidase P family protein [Candidatus Micrarchaeota archaeon]|nr:aminopeptidase P family protein [Candidatus Micrarchaeota archaeon]
MEIYYRGEQFDPNFYYLSKVDIDHSFLIIDGKNRELLTPKMNYEIAKNQFSGKVSTYGADLWDILKRRLGKRTVGADLGALSANLAKKIGEKCTLKDTSKKMLEQRMKKTEAEVTKTKRAAREAREIIEGIDLKNHKTEKDVEKTLKKETIERGLELAFEPIVASGKNTAFPHYHAGEKKLEDIVLIDFGVKYERYCSDLTRCIIMGDNKKLKDEYEKLQNVCDGILDQMNHHKTGADVAKEAEKALMNAGFPKLIHSIGHGVGLEVHEWPRLGLKSEDKIAQTIMAIEPAFYIPGRYGMRFEQTIFFDGKRARVLD